MVDISSQNNKINVTVSSSGNTANTNVTPDYAQYYSEKSKEWAISNRIVDNTDYSSKYYANESKKQADISTAKATEVVESSNTAISNIENARDNAITDVNTAGATQVALATEQATIATNKASEVIESGNTALSNISTAKDNAITSIANQETTSKTSLIDEGATQVGLIQNEGATQIANVQSTGFYMRDDKLYYINSQGEETEFKSGGSGLELCDIGMALYVDETKGLRRYLNGQIVDINTNTQAFLNRLKDITTLHPSLLCTEEEWQTAKTMSAFGQVGKFVFNYSGENIVSVRIPRVVNVQGLFDLQNLGLTVTESLPNITGNATIGVTGVGGSVQSANGVFSKGSNDNYRVSGGSKSDESSWAFYFNASRSSSIYKDNAHVQQEAVQYPYFIQIATGSETENNIINEIELNNPYSLFDFKWTDHEQNNPSWTRGDTFDWKPSATYPSAYNELLSEYNNSESVEETEGDVTFKRTPKGYKIALADQETAIASKYETYGIAWYYLLDTANTQFKLPRTQYGFKGIRDNVGDYIAESLPNITGEVDGNPKTEFSDAKGCFKLGNSSGGNNAGYVSGGKSNFIFDASRSSSTYQDGAPVQERATQMYLYFYVGETVQNANLIDAGRIGEQLANKVDITNTQWATNACMPDYSAGINITQTLKTSPYSYTAPTDGVIRFYISGDTEWLINSTPKKDVNNALVHIDGQPGVYITSYLRVENGQTIYDTGSHTVTVAMFYPLKGAK